ncbi:MAG: hypothetical protein NC099_05095 [Corallococcus sp.]|nr:hypothetical protein [Corallococcus sp.]
MLTIGLIDEGIGVFPMLYKLKQAAQCNYVCVICGNLPPFSRMTSSQAYDAGRMSVSALTNVKCDAIALASVSLSSLCGKRLASECPVPLFASEAPVMHACTYTASGVLVCGEARIVNRLTAPNVTACAMDDFAEIAENCSERQVVEYVNACIGPYEGRFDCIALANSSMNMFKHCFARVCPNVQIFDSLEGVARRIRKKYKKFPKEEGSCIIINQFGEEITEKYITFLE